MGSTYKFESGLNNWVDSDKPVRQDFVNDNEILTDNAMWMEHYDSAGDPANPTHPVREAGGIPAYAMAKANYDASGAVAAAGGIMPVVNNAIASKDGFTTYTHSKAGSVHSLSSTASGKNIKFKVAAGGGFVEGDTFKVNGTARTAKLENGEPLPDAAFAAGATVSCILGDDNVLNFKSGGGAADLKVVCSTTAPASPKEGTIWVYSSIAAGKTYYGSEASMDADALANGDVYVISGNSSVAVKNRKGTVTYTPVAVLQKQAGAMVPVGAVMRQGSVWAIPYPTDGLVNYCTGADLINKVDDVAGTKGSAMNIVSDVTAGNVLQGTANASSYLEWSNNSYRYVKKSTMIGAVRTSASDGGRVLQYIGTGSNGAGKIIIIDNGRIGMSIYGTALYGTTSVADGVWHVYTGIWDHDNASNKLFLDNNIELAGAICNTTSDACMYTLGAPNGSKSNTRVLAGNAAHVFLYDIILPENVALCLSRTVLNRVKGLM